MKFIKNNRIKIIVEYKYYVFYMIKEGENISQMLPEKNETEERIKLARNKMVKELNLLIHRSEETQEKYEDMMDGNTSHDVLEMEEESIIKYLNQASLDKKLYEEVKNFPDHRSIVFCLSRISSESFSDIIDSNKNNSTDALVREVIMIINDFENQALGEDHLLGEESFHEFKVSLEKMRALNFFLTYFDKLGVNKEDCLAKITKLFIRSMAHCFNLYECDIPPRLKLLLRNDSNFLTILNEDDKDEIDDFIEQTREKRAELFRKKQQKEIGKLIKKGVHPKIADRVVQEKDNKFFSKFNQVFENRKKMEDFSKELFNKYPDLKEFIKKLLAD